MTSLTKPSLEDLLEDPGFKRTVDNLAYGFITKYGSNPLIDREELRNEALLAATIAYGSFDPERGCRFKTHAFPYMQNAMNTFCRRYCHVLSISEKDARTHLGDMLGVGIMRIDQHQDENGEEFDIPVGSGVEANYDLADFLFTGFTAFERTIATEYFLEEKSLQNIAHKYNMSKSRVGSIIAGLRTRMARRAEDVED